jgi:hypothetical protein
MLDVAMTLHMYVVSTSNNHTKVTENMIKSGNYFNNLKTYLFLILHMQRNIVLEFLCYCGLHANA